MAKKKEKASSHYRNIFAPKGVEQKALPFGFDARDWLPGAISIDASVFHNMKSQFAITMASMNIPTFWVELDVYGKPPGWIREQVHKITGSWGQCVLGAPDFNSTWVATTTDLFSDDEDDNEEQDKSIFRENESVVIYEWGIARYNTTSGGQSVVLLTVDIDMADAIDKALVDFSKPPKENKKKVYTLINMGTGYSLTAVGIGGIRIKEDNYTTKVFAEYKHVVSDINSKDPSGRVIILDGPPGSGKTYMVRHLIDSCKNAVFVLIPPAMLPELTGPSLVSVLIQYRSPERPIVLVLEDADNCLAKRASDNMSTISTLLNLSDGILGNLLDIRILATTNAKIEEIDPAIMRPGRLSQRIEIDALPYDQAQKVYSRENGKGVLPLRETYTLAEVYHLAKGFQIEAEKEAAGTKTKVTSNKGRIGFGG
jgi:hypothetical protein